MYFNNKLVIIHSKRTLEQLKVFIWKNGKPQSAQGYNDDIVLALAFGLWIRDTAVRQFGQSMDITKKTLELFNTSTNYYGLYNSNAPIKNPYVQQQGKIQEDFSWVL